MLTAGVACELRKAINAGRKLLFRRGLATPGAFAKSRLPARSALDGAHWAPAPHRRRGMSGAVEEYR